MHKLTSDLLDISLTPAVIHAKLYYDLFVWVEQLFVKFRNYVHYVAGLETQTLAASNHVIKVPLSIDNSLLLICHEQVEFLSE